MHGPKIAGYCPYIPVSEPAANERTFFDIAICANSPLLEIEMLSMQIRVGFEIVYEFVARTPVVLMLNVHPSRAIDMIEPDQLRITPAQAITRYLDAFGNICTRLVAPAEIGRASCRERGET